MAHLIRDDRARLHYQVRPGSRSAGTTFVFQHGMGGTLDQPLGYLPEHPGVDLVSMDARGHGDSSDLLGEGRCSFDAFADDVIALLDHLGQQRVILGGISMGSAVALNVALRYPDRVAALVLCRPAWVHHAQDELNRSTYRRIADLLDTHEPDRALQLLEQEPGYQQVRAASVAASGSLRHQVQRPRAAVNADLLRTLPASSPAPDRAAWAEIAVPTLVLAHTDDPLHPWDVAVQTSENIPGAQLVQVPSKDASPAGFQAQIAAAIGQFLTRLSEGGVA